MPPKSPQTLAWARVACSAVLVQEARYKKWAESLLCQIRAMRPHATLRACHLTSHAANPAIQSEIIRGLS